MPQGKGTYGSQVGRPRKKKEDGGSILKKTRDILTDDLNDPDDYFLGKYWDRFRDRERSFGDRFSDWRDRRRSTD